MELFLLPEAKLNSYWKVVLSPSNHRFCAWHMLGKYGQRNSSATEPRNIETAVRRTAEGYSAEIAFPFSALPSLSAGLPHTGAVIHLMLCRTNLKKDGKHVTSAPVPLLYGGRNIYGYIKAILSKQESH